MSKNKSKIVGHPKLKKQKITIKTDLLDNNLNPVLDGDGKAKKIELRAIIQEPGIDEYDEMMACVTSSKFAAAGRVLFNTCCVDYSPEIDEEMEGLNRLKYSVAVTSLFMRIANHYAPNIKLVDEEIKKN